MVRGRTLHGLRRLLVSSGHRHRPWNGRQEGHGRQQSGIPQTLHGKATVSRQLPVSLALLLPMNALLLAALVYENDFSEQPGNCDALPLGVCQCKLLCCSYCCCSLM